uniref:Uncharacterized protein n=1 Tax=viral metagenome TaxID=1070528 RepID=A0A6C0JQI4_9ZZZZ
MEMVLMWYHLVASCKLLECTHFKSTGIEPCKMFSFDNFPVLVHHLNTFIFDKFIKYNHLARNTLLFLF